MNRQTSHRSLVHFVAYQSATAIRRTVYCYSKVIGAGENGGAVRGKNDPIYAGRVFLEARKRSQAPFYIERLNRPKRV